MNDSKEKLISLVTQTMSENLTVEQLDMLIYTLSNVLQCYDISEAKDLPSVDMDDTNKLIQNFLSCKKIEGCLPNTLIQYQYTINRFASCIRLIQMQFDVTSDLSAKEIKTLMLIMSDVT